MQNIKIWYVWTLLVKWIRMVLSQGFQMKSLRIVLISGKFLISLKYLCFSGNFKLRTFSTLDVRIPAIKFDFWTYKTALSQHWIPSSLVGKGMWYTKRCDLGLKNSPLYLEIWYKITWWHSFWCSIYKSYLSNAQIHGPLFIVILANYILFIVITVPQKLGPGMFLTNFTSAYILSS